VASSHVPPVMRSPASSHVQLLALSPVPSHIPSVAPSPVLSGGPLIAPSSVQSSVPSTCDPLPEPEGLSQFRSRSDRNDNTAGSGHELDLFGPEGAGSEEGEDENDKDNVNIDIFMDPGGSKPKGDVHNWHEL
jgi:hypothetical protein